MVTLNCAAVPENLLEADELRLRTSIETHHRLTGSVIASEILENWPQFLPSFIKITPHEYRQALLKLYNQDAYIDDYREATHG